MRGCAKSSLPVIHCPTSRRSYFFKHTPCCVQHTWYLTSALVQRGNRTQCRDVCVLNLGQGRLPCPLASAMSRALISLCIYNKCMCSFKVHNPPAYSVLKIQKFVKTVPISWGKLAIPPYQTHPYVYIWDYPFQVEH